MIADQVADIALAAAGSGRGAPAPLLSWLDPVALASSCAKRIWRYPKLCKTLIIGLAVLLSFPVGGDLRGVKEVSDELGVGTSSGHRYVLTLRRIGVLAQEFTERSRQVDDGETEMTVREGNPSAVGRVARKRSDAAQMMAGRTQRYQVV